MTTYSDPLPSMSSAYNFSSPSSPPFDPSGDNQSFVQLNLSSSSPPALPLDMAWCFDLLLYYRTYGGEDPQSRKVLNELESYAKFSYIVNGLVTCVLATLGLMGNALFVTQLHARCNHFSRRLASHLTVLCVWDIALLCCCLCSYGVMCMIYGILPFFGLTAYLLYLFQPFASFCVTGTIWQVLAITVERYKAVSRPLEQRTRRGQFSLRATCTIIAVGAFALNFLAVPFERTLVNCYELTQTEIGFTIRTMIVQQELVNNQYYAILSHLVPDLLFRAPTPIIIIAILTVRTLQIASAQRTVGHQHIVPQRQKTLGRNVHLMLTLLSVKFILCNTLYLFNTILMEVMGYGGKTSTQQTELEMEQYIRSLYLTDFSNMMLAIHSATNWLIFYKWPKCKEETKKQRFAASFTLSASSTCTDVLKGGAPIDAHGAELVIKRFGEHREQICANILASLCQSSEAIAKAFGLSEADQLLVSQQIFLQQPHLHKFVQLLGDIIEAVVRPLTGKHYDVTDSMLEWRDFCRQIGYHYFKVNAKLNVEQWKLVRTHLVLAVNRNHNPAVLADQARWQCQARVHQAVLTNLQKALIRTFNMALREMKNGSLCAIVDISQRQLIASNSGNPNGNGKQIGQANTPVRLCKRMTWMNGPPAGIVARAIFPPTSRDSFSLVFPNEIESSQSQSTTATDWRVGGANCSTDQEEQEPIDGVFRRGTLLESASLLMTEATRRRNANGIFRSEWTRRQQHFQRGGKGAMRKQQSDGELLRIAATGTENSNGFANNERR